MKASAAVVAGGERGRPHYEVLRSDPPLLLRPTGEALHLVGGAAGPLGGDQLRYEVAVRPGGRLVVRSAAASIVLPGSCSSSLDVTVTLGPGASIDWQPEPLVSVTASRHRQRTDITMADDAVLNWREAVVLGRSGQGPGALATTLRVERGGRPLTHQELRIGHGTEGWDGPAGVGDAGVVVTELVVGPGYHETRVEAFDSRRAGVLAIADDASLRTAVGPDLVAAHHALAKVTGRDPATPGRRAPAR